MKSIKKIFAGLLMATAAFGFFGCSDDSEDENLTIEISAPVTGSSATVTLIPSYEVTGIIYTTDGTEPSARYDASEENKVKLVGEIYNAPFTVNETTTIKAVGYVLDAVAGKVTYGVVATKLVEIGIKTTNGAATIKGGNDNNSYEFLVAESGNSNINHYFDTSANKFTYKYGDQEYQDAYYQIQFTWKGTGTGNWYLYAKTGATTIKDTDNATAFIARGTYTGSCFDASNGNIVTGDLVLKTAKGNVWNNVSVTNNEGNNNRNYKLTMTVTADKITAAVNDAK